MTATREAIALPLVFLTVALFGGLRITEGVALLPPPALRTRPGGAPGLASSCDAAPLAPERLVHTSRSMLAQSERTGSSCWRRFWPPRRRFNVATPESGAPRVPVQPGFLILLANTIAASSRSRPCAAQSSRDLRIPPSSRSSSSSRRCHTLRRES